MNRSALSFALALVLSGTLAFAQQQPESSAPSEPVPAHQHRAPNPQREARHLAKQLGLTPDQAAKLEPILAERDQKMADLRTSTLAPDQMHQQRHAIQENAMEQLSSVLTPDQMQQFRSMRHHGGHHKQGAPAQPQPAV